MADKKEKMNKKGIIKLSLFFLVLFLILAIVFFSIFSSASVSYNKENYFVGEEINLDFSGHRYCFIDIKTPSDKLNFECSERLSFVFEEPGEYIFNIDYLNEFEKFEINVLDKDFSQEDLGNLVQEYKNYTLNTPLINTQDYFIFDFKNKNSYTLNSSLEFNFREIGNYELIVFFPSGKKISRLGSNDRYLLNLLEEGEYLVEIVGGNRKTTYTFLSIKDFKKNLVQGKAEIGKPVKWIKELDLIEEGNFIEIPTLSGIKIENENGETFNEYSLVELDNKSYILIDSESPEKLFLEYITESPSLDEEIISETRKQVTIFSPEEFHYRDVLSYTSIPERLSAGQENLIKIYWIEEDTYLDFNALDTDSNGFLDYVEWIVPHLSTQTFEIIIITKADHLGSNKEFISDIYNEVRTLDNVWSEEINDGEYVRVVFEIPLSNLKDITIFPKVISGNPVVEVYEVDSNEKITEFSNLISEEYNKIYLENLISDTQDTFDLKIVGGSLQFDHIIDPTGGCIGGICTYNFTYSETWQVPNNVLNNNITVRVWGGGGAGAGRTNNGRTGGGGGGAFASSNIVVTPGENLRISVGDSVAGGTGNGANGIQSNVSWQNNTVAVRAAGGNGGTTTAGGSGGTVANSLGTIRYAGGNGAFTSSGNGGGGGGGAGTTGAGASATSSTGGIGNSLYGGNGSNGAGNANAPSGFIYGGGGGGVSRTSGSRSGGAGAQGFVQIIYQEIPDTTPPTYNSVSIDNIYSGEQTTFSIRVSDNEVLHPIGGYIFSTNNSGSWTNDTFVIFTETPSWANVTKLLNTNVKTAVGYRWYLNDSSGNTASTPIYTLTTLKLPQTFVYNFTVSEIWQVPNNILNNNITVRTWGGGGAGAGATSNLRTGGGGGGAFASSSIIVTPGENLTIRVGGSVAGTTGNGANGIQSNVSWQNNTVAVRAAGGTGGATNARGTGGTVANSLGTIRYAGGDGYYVSNSGNGGGGGGGAGTTGAGASATSSTGATGTSLYGGNGGTGSQNPAGTSGNGSNYGGGGAGLRRTSGNRIGGTGAQGFVQIIYQETPDITPPTYNSVSVDTIYSDTQATFSINVLDNSNIHPTGGYIFSTNNSGSWTNDTFVIFTETPSWANTTKSLNPNPGTNVGYRWYFNDSSGNTASTPIYTLRTEKEPGSKYTINSTGSASVYAVGTTSSNRWAAGTASSVAQRANMSLIDNRYARVATTANNRYPFYRFNFTIEEQVFTISSIFIRFTGYKTSSQTATLYVWNFATRNWVLISDIPDSPSDVTLNITNNIGDYIDDNQQLVIIAEGNRFSARGNSIFVDYVSVNVLYEEDTTPPTYNSVSIDNIYSGELTIFSINISDNAALHPNGGYIFSTNNSGLWVNDSFVSFTETPSWANTTKSLNPNKETAVGYRWYLNDSSGNTASTPIYTLTTLRLPQIFIYNFTGSGTWRVPDNVENNNITVRVWGGGGAGAGLTATGYGGGGGGGAFASSNIIVTPGENLRIYVGGSVAGTTGNGANGIQSNVSWQNNTLAVRAAGGNGGTTTAGGTGGTVANSLGTIRYAGGNGFRPTSGTTGGGGGGGAGTTGTGGSSTSQIGGTGTLEFGGDGGNGGALNGNGNPGQSYGGGGGGTRRTSGNRVGGGGAQGFVQIIYFGEEDITPPTYGDPSTDNIFSGELTTFSIEVSDNAALHPRGGYIFSTNNSGSWVNDSFVSFTETPSLANSIKTLHSTVGAVVSYRWYFNDSSGNTASTPIYTLRTEKEPGSKYTINSTGSASVYAVGTTSSNRWAAGTASSVAQRANMSLIDNRYARVATTANNRYPFYRFNFTIEEQVFTISSIFIRFTGYKTSSQTATLYVWNFATRNWVLISDIPDSPSDVTLNITNNIGDYIDDNQQLVIIAEGNRFSARGNSIFVDYVGVTTYYVKDVIPPSYSSVSVNNTEPDEPARFSIRVSDNIALHPRGGYIFSTNNSGSWMNDSFVSFTETPSWANVTKILSQEELIPIGYRWYFNDTSGNTVSTPIYTLRTDAYPPSASQVQCERAGSWRDCSTFKFSDTITRVRISCGGEVINAGFNLINIPDSRTFFNSNSTSNEGNWWIYDNADLIINDSGTFNLTGVCYGPSSQTESFVNWTVPWGRLEVDLVNPNMNTNVNPNEFFDFTASVRCVEGECGFVNITLDPTDSWWNKEYENRRLINITNPSNSILVQNYTMLVVVDTTGEEFKSNGDDLRIVYWNGTHNIEIDRYNSTSFDDPSTEIWFRIQSNISSRGYSDNYYIYYNNKDALNPPSNGSRVFEFFDDFNRPNSGTIGNGWTETSGTWDILNGKVRNTYGGDSDLTRTTITDNHSLRAIATPVVYDADFKLSIRSSTSFTSGYTFGYQNNYMELTTEGHTTNNLGSSPFSIIEGNTYEIEINTVGNRIVAYANGNIIFNLTNTAFSSGRMLLHSWDITDFDDVWLRKLIDIEPVYSLGAQEKVSKGILSTVVGDIPFYTTSRNPMDYRGTSCLSDMKSGDVCDVTWHVNSTGKIGSIWEFFVFANTTNYTNYFNSSDTSSYINITIGNLPPEIPELNFPANNSALTTIGEFNWSNSRDPTGDTVYYMIQISNSPEFTNLIYSNYNIPEQDTITGITPTGITQEGAYYWRVLATDLKSNSSWSETRIFYYDLSPPIVNLISPEHNSIITYSNTIDFIFNVNDLSDIQRCDLIINDSVRDTLIDVEKNTNVTFTFSLLNSFYNWRITCADSAGREGYSETRLLNVDVSNNPPKVGKIECEKKGVWQNCSSIVFGDTLTRVRVFCSDPEESVGEGVVNASINLTNIPDAHTFFEELSFEEDGYGFWMFNNLNFKINDSGEFIIYATCYDEDALSGTNSTSWNVPWGTFAIDLINPNSDIKVLKDNFFTFSSRIKCINGECGNANVTLDPPNWWNETWSSRKTINITNSGETSLLNFPIYINLSKEPEMQANFNDIRFINGSCGSTGNYLYLDYEIENYTSSKADVWINIPRFSPGVNQICMYYDNQFALSGQNPIRVWDNSYLTVQHLEETGTGIRYDSKYRRNFTTTGYDNDENVFGIIGGADLLDGVNDALTSGNSFLNNLGAFTIEGWIKPRAWGSRVSFVGQNDLVEFFLDGSNTISIWTANGGSTSTSYPFSLNTWHYLSATGTGSNILIYLDGVQVASGGSSTSNYGTSTYHVKIGEGVVDASGGFFNGTMDEVRISNISRSADWISQSYQIINNQSNLVSFGIKEEKTKGIISTVAGTTPFYTTTPNPLDSTTFSCLENMKSSGGSCDVSWNVNATGELNSVWKFFVTSNNLNNQEYYNTSSKSKEINITISSQIPPTVPQLYRPLNNTAYPVIPNLNWTNSTDQNRSKIYYIIEVSDNYDFSTIVFANYSIPETSSPTGITPTGISQEGAYYWRVKSSNLNSNSSWSETRVFYYDTSAPQINFINQTGEDNRHINNTNWLNRGENLTIFIDVTDINTNYVWVVVWQSIVGGVEKLKIFFNKIGDSLWKAEISTNQTWDDSYNYTIYANDTVGHLTNYTSNFTVLGGNTSIYLTEDYVVPPSNVSVYGHAYLSNSTALSNHPINIWVDGKFLFLQNLTPEGEDYIFYKQFLETSNSEFSQGTFYNTEVQNNQNLILSDGEAYGEFTKILDAGAIVHWDNLSWNFQGASCSGVYTYQHGDTNGYLGTEDSYISSGFPNINYGSSNSIIVDGSPTSERGLILFKNIIGKRFNQIPENSTINSANLAFYISDTGDQVGVYQVLEEWNENSVTYNNRGTGSPWSSAGCSGSPSRAIMPDDTFTAIVLGKYTVNITNSLKNWVSGQENYGWVFNMPTSNGIEIRSKEYIELSERPLLTVDYESDECTDVRVYIRTSNNKLTWTEWREVSNLDSINDPNIYSRYLQYKVELSSTSTSLTPTLEDLTFHYTALTTDSNGDYNYTLVSPSGFGYHNVTVNTGFSTIFIENTTSFFVQAGLPPNVSLIYPGNNHWFSEEELTLIYNASDLNDDIILSELIINGVVNRTNSTPIINNEYNEFIINLESGVYNWTVNVTDSSGYTATAPLRIFYVDLINPNISLVYPREGDSFVLSELNLSFNVTDNMATNLSCSVTLDGEVIHPLIWATSHTITNVSSGPLTGGAHYWNVTCTDNALRSFTSPTLSFDISDTPPEVVLILPEPDYLDSDGEVSFTYTVSDNSGILNCSLYIDNVFKQANSTPVINNQENTFNIQGLSEGIHNWTVECFDLSSNSHKPSPLSLRVDLYSPSITLNYPMNLGTSLTSNVYFNFTVVDSFDPYLDCNLTINGLVVDTFNATSGVMTSRLIEKLADDTKLWSVSCVDEAGHLGTSLTWRVNITEAPKVVLNTLNNSRYNSNTITLNYTPSDNTGISSCSLYLNGNLNQVNQSPVLNKMQNSFSVNSLPEGIYNWYVECKDYIGLSNQSETRIFYIDRTGPLIEVFYPRGDDVYNSNITFNFTAIDYLDTNIHCNITVNSSVVDSNILVSNGTLISREVSGISDGYNVWSVTCWDSLGNANTSPIFDFIRYTHPKVTLISPENNTWFNTSSFNLTYFPEDDGGIISASLYINGIHNRSNSTIITNRANNVFEINGFPEGSYFWNVNVTDTTYLTGIDEERRFYVDTTPPNIQLNSPYESEVITTNNVTFDFKVWDNLAEHITCEFTLNEELESSRVYINDSGAQFYSILRDGDHSWSIRCIDNASNHVYSGEIEFSVKAPPIVSLISPENNSRTASSEIDFSYIPYDLIGITSCRFYLDGELNSTNSLISENIINNFNIKGISEGIHSWTVNCSDSDNNWNWSEENIFYRDITPPSIILHTPENDTGIDSNLDRIYFNWTAIDILDDSLQCNLTLDGITRKQDIWITSGISNREYIFTSTLEQGAHYWNVTCWDQVGNANTSELRVFNLTYPDFLVSDSEIFLNESLPKENQPIEITATIRNLGGVDVGNVTVSFYIGDPDLGGYKLSPDTFIAITKFGAVNVTKSWTPEIGSSEVFVIVDPPLITNGTYKELNESNNKARKEINVGSWHFFYGDVFSSSNLVLANNNSKNLINWDAETLNKGNVYVVDYDSQISWTSLQAIGKNKAGQISNSDFSEIDSALNTIEFEDSVYNVYTDLGTPKYFRDIIVFRHLIEEVPIINSTNNSNFVTGILWDTSDDTGGASGEFDLTDREDLVFISPINKHEQGAYGVYDYELRVPARLREYKTGDLKSASFYVELF